MAEEREETDRSEDPTQKRRDDALERGDVAKSQEVNTWFMLSGALLALFAFGGAAASGIHRTLGGLVANSHRFAFESASLIKLAEKLALEVLGAVAIPFLLLTLAAIAGNMIQHPLVWSAEGLKPKLARISLLAGAKRLFSKQALVNFAKGLAKIALIGTLMTWLLWSERHRLDGTLDTDPGSILDLTAALSLKLLAAVAAVLAIVAALDYFYQYQVWFGRQKMSLRELKEEFKQTEGDPTMKGRFRQIRQTRMRKRMMAAVPQASVVIANPTHFAVALRYEPGMNAPLCLAKGADLLALKIRELAARHDIPVVENPPLARALHATVEVDREIPPEHYKAVAEVIGYIMNLRRAFGR